VTGRRHRWQAQWSRLPNGDLQHASGLIVNVTLGDGYTDLRASHGTLPALNAWLIDVRRTAPHDMQRAAQRIVQEAAQWRRENP